MPEKYNNEKVLVIKNNIIFKNRIWQGLMQNNISNYYDLIKNNSEFIYRSEAENNKNYQQIIPYILFKYKQKFFLYQYLKNATETRLHHNYILGIAGHINPIDGEKDDIIESGMMREWNEEVEYKGNIVNKKLVGILNDDRREVEEVHLGLIYIFEGNTPDIILKESDKMKGSLMTIEEMEALIGSTEYLGWAPLIYPYLKNY